MRPGVDYRQRRGNGREETVKLAPLALILGLLAPCAMAAESIGRLFYTPEQRTELDTARSKRVRGGPAAEKPEEAPPQPTPEVVTYGGMVRRSDGETTVLLNNRAVTGKNSVEARMLGKVRPDGTVTLQSPQTGRRVDLRVGQRAELLSGEVQEVYRRAPALQPEGDIPGIKLAPEPDAAAEADRRQKQERERQENLDDAVRALRDAAQARSASNAPQQPGTAPVPGSMQPAAPGTVQAPAQPYQ